jgi:hypothetical protein
MDGLSSVHLCVHNPRTTDPLAVILGREKGLAPSFTGPVGSIPAPGTNDGGKSGGLRTLRAR